MDIIATTPPTDNGPSLPKLVAAGVPDHLPLTGSTPVTPSSNHSPIFNCSLKPGANFNHCVPWSDILGPHGWDLDSQKETCQFWRRPGKTTPGSSAVVNSARGDLLYVFSPRAQPFQCRQAYSKFSAYALLNHGGDWQQAATVLRALGYGHPQQDLSRLLVERQVQRLLGQSPQPAPTP